jgi:hypothetical protein
MEKEWANRDCPACFPNVCCECGEHVDSIDLFWVDDSQQYECKDCKGNRKGWPADSGPPWCEDDAVGEEG